MCSCLMIFPLKNVYEFYNCFYIQMTSQDVLSYYITPEDYTAVAKPVDPGYNPWVMGKGWANIEQ